jgi:vacuolar-type H+-ATPase subunit H
MTDDLEKLKLIREAEDSANKEIEKARKEYEDRLSEFSLGLENEVQRYRLKTEEDFRKNMESFRSDLEKKTLEIRERGRLKAEKLSLKISDKEIEKLVEKALLDYIKED